MEGPSYSKLAHFVSHHVFADIDGDELLAVMDGKGQPDGEPVLTVDNLGAGPGMRVLISSDGKGARELVGSKDSPVRWLTIGVLDE